MKSILLPAAITITLFSLVACDAPGGAANDPRFQPTTPVPEFDTKQVSPGDRAPVQDTLGVDSLRDSSLDSAGKAHRP